MSVKVYIITNTAVSRVITHPNLFPSWKCLISPIIQFQRRKTILSTNSGNGTCISYFGCFRCTAMPSLKQPWCLSRGLGAGAGAEPQRGPDWPSPPQNNLVLPLSSADLLDTHQYRAPKVSPSRSRPHTHNVTQCSISSLGGLSRGAQSRAAVCVWGSLLFSFRHGGLEEIKQTVSLHRPPPGPTTLMDSLT